MPLSKADILAKILAWLKGDGAREELEILVYRYPFIFVEVVSIWSICGYDLATTERALAYATENGGASAMAALEAMRLSGRDPSDMAEMSAKVFGGIGGYVDRGEQRLAHYILCQVATMTGQHVRDVLTAAKAESDQWESDLIHTLIALRIAAEEENRQ